MTTAYSLSGHNLITVNPWTVMLQVLKLYSLTHGQIQVLLIYFGHDYE